MTNTIVEEPKTSSRPVANVSTTRLRGVSASAARAHLTDEESIVLRALVAGHNQKQICKDLRMDSGAFHRLMRDLREKTGAADPVGLVIWALRQATNGDQRTEERYHPYIRPSFANR